LHRTFSGLKSLTEHRFLPNSFHGLIKRALGAILLITLIGIQPTSLFLQNLEKKELTKEADGKGEKEVKEGKEEIKNHHHGFLDSDDVATSESLRSNYLTHLCTKQLLKVNAENSNKIKLFLLLCRFVFYH